VGYVNGVRGEGCVPVINAGQVLSGASLAKRSELLLRSFHLRPAEFLGFSRLSWAYFWPDYWWALLMQVV
jgi:hypothetical protein